MSKLSQSIFLSADYQKLEAQLSVSQKQAIALDGRVIELEEQLSAERERAKVAEARAYALPDNALQLVDAVNNLLEEIATGGERLYGFDGLVQVVHKTMEPFNLAANKALAELPKEQDHGA